MHRSTLFSDGLHSDESIAGASEPGIHRPSDLAKLRVPSIFSQARTKLVSDLWSNIYPYCSVANDTITTSVNKVLLSP